MIAPSRDFAPLPSLRFAPAVAVAHARTSNLTRVDGTKAIINIGFQIVGKTAAISIPGDNNNPDLELLPLKIVTAALHSCFIDFPVLKSFCFELETNPIDTLVETSNWDWTAQEGLDGRWYGRKRYDNDGLFDDLEQFISKMTNEKQQEVCIVARAQQRGEGHRFVPLLIRSVQSAQRHQPLTPARFGKSWGNNRSNSKKGFKPTDGYYSDDGWGEPYKPVIKTARKIFTIEWLAIDWMDFMRTPFAAQFILNDAELDHLNHPEGVTIYQPSRSIYFVLQSIYRTLSQQPMDKRVVELEIMNLFHIIEKSCIIRLHPLIVTVLNRIRKIVPTDAATLMMEVHDKFFVRPKYSPFKHFC